MAPSTPSTASQQPGMGAIPYPGGVTFRVWAPYASAVFVAGDFNTWSTSANPLNPEGSSGYWSCDVPSALAGQQYKFITGPAPLWKIDPYAKSVVSSVGNGIICPPSFAWGNDGFQMPVWNELVIYELHIGTFNDIATGTPGTFDTAILKLPYLADLGINAIEVMPIHEFPDQFNVGYDPCCLFAADDTYGGPLGLQRFVQSAHQNGIAVILDVVFNHFGPSFDLGASLWQFDGWQQNGMGGIYFYDDWRAWTPWGDDNRPDFGRPEVRQFIRDNALYWLQQFQIDGLRVDSTNYIRNVYGNNNDPAHDIPEGWELLQYINDSVNQIQAWKITIAEDLQGNGWITTPTGSSGAGFGSQWDDWFADAIRTAVIGPDDSERDISSVASAISSSALGAGATNRVIYTESHDDAACGKSRVPDAIWPGNSGSYFSKKRSTLGAAAALSSPGIPMLLQGQEFLEYRYFDDDENLQWDLLQQYGGIHDLYRDLIRLRRNWFGNTAGLTGPNVNVFFASEADKVIAFHRWANGGPGDDVVVVLNFANQAYESYTVGFPAPGTWWVRFNSDFNGYSPDFGNWNSYDTTASAPGTQGMPCCGNIGIGAYSAVVLSQ